MSRWRLLLGVVLTVVVGFVLDGGDVADRAVQPDLVEPGDPAAGRELEVVDIPERAVTGFPE